MATLTHEFGQLAVHRLDTMSAGQQAYDGFTAGIDVAARVVQTMRLPVVVLAADATIRAANRAFFLTTSALPDVVVGLPLWQVCNGAFSVDPLRARVEALGKEEGSSFANVTFCLDGGDTPRWFEADGCDVVEQTAGERLMLVTFANVTSVVEARDAAERWLREVERSNRELEQFASVAAHDLQEPIRKVLAFGERLAVRAAPALDATSHEYLERILAAARRGQLMISGLLALSRASTRPLDREQVALDDVLADVMADLEVQIQRTAGTVTADPLPTLLGDATMLRQLLQNLVSNALKFHREEAPPVVRITAERVSRPAAWRIRITDNGIGFEDRFIDRLFVPFSRLNPRSGFEGAGIGLALCHRIMQRHGGIIAATGRPGEGAEFTMLFPDIPEVV